ncbi:MAG: hypothetical protein PHW62_03610 [Candidatus Ratteibacteria bacterium]|nr:hypothetical protein [Candidatus Ratteibacteria bacterium]
MKKVAVISLVCLMCVFLVSCAASKKSSAPVQRAGTEYAKLVFMGDECIAWFSPDLTVIGRMDMVEYLKENKLKPEENEILEHFASLGWEVIGTPRKDKYTKEYQFKRTR